MKKDSYTSVKKGMSSEIKRVLIIVSVSFLLLLFMYFLTTKILAKSNDDNKNKITEKQIQYDEILAGESFNQKEDEYYVIYYDSTDEYSSFSSLISSYQLNSENVRLYSVDLSRGFNKKYISESDIVTSDAFNLKVKATTLLKFSDGDVTDVITDVDKIMEIIK